MFYPEIILLFQSFYLKFILQTSGFFFAQAKNSLHPLWTFQSHKIELKLIQQWAFWAIRYWNM